MTRVNSGGAHPKKYIFALKSTKPDRNQTKSLRPECHNIGMRSESQIQASRAKGAKSCDPVTPEGKHTSSLNATTHGMLSSTIPLNCESEDRFRELFAALFDEFQPESHFEVSLIENMAVARWRHQRIWSMEKAAMEHEMRLQAGAPQVTDDAATCAELAFRTLVDNTRTLDLFHRYESLYDRQYLRAHRRLLEVRDRRTPPSVPDVQPVPELQPTPEPQPMG